MIEISERQSKEYEQLFKESSARYEALVNTIPGGIAIYELCNRKALLRYFSDGFIKMFGYEKEEAAEMLEEDAIMRIYPEDIEMVQNEIDSAVTERRSISCQYRVNKKDNSIIWIWLRGAILKEENGNQFIHTILTDITKEQEAKLELITEKRKYELALENSDIFVWEYDIADKKYKIRGERADNIFSNDKVHKQSEDEFDRIHREVRQGASSAEADICYQINNGKEVWRHIKYITIYDAADKPIKAVGCATDCTALWAIQERYKRELSYMDNLKGDNFLASLRANLNKDYIVDYNIGNPRMHNMYSERTFSEVTKIIIDNIPDLEQRSRFEAIFQCGNLIDAYQSGEKKYTIEYKRVFENDEIRWVSTTAKLLKNPDAEEIICFFYTYDIHEEKTAKELMQRVVALDYDYAICLEGKRNSYVMFPSENGSVLPPRECDDYNSEIIAYIDNFMVREDRERLYHEMSLANVKEQLSKMPVYSVNIRTMEYDGSVSQKLLQYSYINQKTETILMTRRNITKLVEAEHKQKEELRQALEAAREANRAKSDFLSRMSHEIRTPMNAILGMVALAHQYRESPEQTADCLNKIDISARYLLSLINDILDMSKIESGKVLLKQDVINFQEFVERIHTIIVAQAEEKGVSYEVQIDSLKGESYLGDSMKLQQILINLLSNAVKFTPSGGKVFFTLHKEENGSDEVKLYFLVKDNGIGINEKFIPHLFEPFAQEEKGLSTVYGGTGLGLAICNHLVKLMGGKIRVKSKVNVGTEFIVELYLKKSICPAARPKLKQCVDYHLAGKRVLLVEDHPLNIEVAQNLLLLKNMEVEVALNGREAVEKFSISRKNYYSAILMDIRMPVMDGLTATRVIRETPHEDAQGVPIIAMTADAFDEDVEKARNAGMNAYLSKPIDPPLLYETLAHCILQ